MTTVESSRPAIRGALPNRDSLGGNQPTEISPRATPESQASVPAPEGTTDTRAAISSSATRITSLGGDNSRQAMTSSTANLLAPAGEDPRPTICTSEAIDHTSGGTYHAGRQSTVDSHPPCAASVQLDGQGTHDARSGTAVDQPGPVATGAAMPKRPPLLDPALAFAADVLDDIERVRIANENRLRQLTRSVEDSDGEVRGFGLDESHPDVARLAAIVGTLAEVEKDATKHLTTVMKRHPLHGWAKGMKGVGDKQIARLLAVIGDPYWRPEIVRDDDTVIPAGPRTVSALWAYCGLHTTPVGGQPLADTHARGATDGSNFPASPGHIDTHAPDAGRVQLADRHPDHQQFDGQDLGVWVAARRQRGQKANWSTKAKMRAYLIAESCSKQLRKPCAAGNHVEDCRCSPYRVKYDRRRATTSDRVHAAECVRCGPAGKPAQQGTPWSDGHKHADALRIVAKEILKDLWRAARGLHLGGDRS